MTYTFEYRPQLPHGTAWTQGYDGASCDKAVQELGSQAKGPRNGLCMRMIQIPWHGSHSLYLRFWAARGGNTYWNDFADAYDEQGPMEKEPSLDFPNGGMVKVSKKGKAKFRLHLPQGYMSDKGFVPPHFHYCLCYRGRRSPVQTVYIERSVPCPTNKPMLVHSNPSDLEVGLREIFRHKFHTFRDLEVARPRQARFTT